MVDHLIHDVLLGSAFAKMTDPDGCAAHCRDKAQHIHSYHNIYTYNKCGSLAFTHGNYIQIYLQEFPIIHKLQNFEKWTEMNSQETSQRNLYA